MRAQHQIAQNLRVILLIDVADRLEVSKRLRHLMIVNVQECVVHPVMDKGLSVGTFRLRDLILMVRENKILSAGMNVDGLAKIFSRHHRALNVPAGTAIAPRRLPVGLSVLLRLPENEVQRVSFLILSRHGNAAHVELEIVQILVGKLSVVRILANREVHGPVTHDIGKALVDQTLNHVNHSVNFLRRLRMRGRGLHIQVCHILPALPDIALRDHRGINALFVCFLNDLVIHIGKIGDVVDLISFVFKIPANRIKYDHRSRISDVNQIVNGRSADIHADLSLFNRLEFLEPFGFGVVNFNPHGNSSPDSGKAV